MLDSEWSADLGWTHGLYVPGAWIPGANRHNQCNQNVIDPLGQVDQEAQREVVSPSCSPNAPGGTSSTWVNGYRHTQRRPPEYLISEIG